MKKESSGPGATLMKLRVLEPELCHFYDGSAALAINVLYVAFWAFVINCENQELI